jgi:nuclear GTP-binding protein
MPRIRKKTSNRQATRDRAKINKKVAEHKKKSKRDAKRNPTWKSKKKPDLGVPSSFHLKDQVLAEMADEKRRSAEAKIAAKEAARRAREGEGSDDEDAPGISSLVSAVLPRALTGVAPLPVEEDDDVPDLLDSDLPTLQAALDAADILLEVVDARDIQGGRSAHVEKLVTDSEGQVWLVINKADLVPREALEGWLKALDLPAYVVSAKEGWGCAELLEALSGAAKKKDEFKVALLGLPNVGKSAVANALLGADKFKVRPDTLTSSSKHPVPTTVACAEAELPSGVRVIDTPGWEYVEEESDEEDEDEDEDGDAEMESDEEDEEKAEAAAAKWDALEARVAGDLLRRNLGRVDKVKDIFPLMNYVFTRSNPQDLMLKYNVPYFPNGDLQAFLTGLARVNGRVKTVSFRAQLVADPSAVTRTTRARPASCCATGRSPRSHTTPSRPRVPSRRSTRWTTRLCSPN